MGKIHPCRECETDSSIKLWDVHFCLDCFNNLTWEDRSRIGEECRNRKASARKQKARDAADIPKFRALAKRAAELGERREIADNLNADQILDELAAMHPETNNA